MAGDTPRLTRSRSDRVVAGVCGGLARYFGVDPFVIRVVAVACTLAGGTGAVAYAAAWLLLPESADTSTSSTSSAPSPEGTPATAADRRYDLLEVLAIGSIALGVLLMVRASGIWFRDALVWPVLLAGAGVAVIWRQASTDDRPLRSRVVEPLLRPGGETVGSDLRLRRLTWARVVVGVVLVVSGVGYLLAASAAFSAIREGVVASAVMVAGLALITGPWWLRLGRELTRERRQRIRSEERAEVAAHLHDSVLQTLALIQRNADDPRTVVTMARRQERELRGWLYEHEPEAAPPAQTLAAAVNRAAEEVEGLHGVTIDVVAVGDSPMDEHLWALVAAAREAMVNAATWSGAPTVSVYAEIGDEVSLFVRDWGTGFDPATVAPDRRGLRDSVVGRMERHGGSATLRSTVGEGTEVELRMARERRQ